MYQTQSPQNYYPGPQVNAVKIDIINPQAYGQKPMPQQGMMPYAQGQYYYNLPHMPVYDMPTQSSYMPYQQNNVAPVQEFVPPVMTAPAEFAQPVLTAPQQPPVIMNQNNGPAAVPVVPPVNLANEPASVVQSAPNADVVATPPKAETAEAKPAEKEQGIDVAVINADLKSSDLEKQFEAIQKIAEIEQNSPEIASSLLTEETFTSLGGILTNDNSALPGPTQEQLELREKLQTGGTLSPEEQTKAEELSPREIAEMNKQYATYSSAVLLKAFREEVAKDPEIASVPLSDLPLVSIIVENLKGNDNPLIREASISAVNYLAKPEDKEVVTTLFKIAAEQDQDEYVVAAAKEGITNAEKLVA